MNGPGRRQRNHLVWIGALVSTFGLVSYFTLFATYPSLRDTAWLNLVLVGIGLTLSVLAVRRRRSWLSLGGALLSVACVVLLAGYVFGLSQQLPPTDGVIAVGAVAPDFSLPDQTGAKVSLADFAERPVVLVFYRGFW